jgi:hypothetical protein
MADTKNGKGSAQKAGQPTVARDRRGLSRRGRHVTKGWPSGYRRTTPERIAPAVPVPNL